jgi:hypothetical protein
MPECLECERLRKKYSALMKKYLKAANRWLYLKRFIIEQEKGVGDGNKEFKKD